jgi:hypothetical protein
MLSCRFVLAEKAHVDARLMYRVFGFVPITYYGRERNQQSEHAIRDAELLDASHRIFAKFRGRYGAPRIQGELTTATGEAECDREIAVPSGTRRTQMAASPPLPQSLSLGMSRITTSGASVVAC